MTQGPHIGTDRRSRRFLGDVLPPPAPVARQTAPRPEPPRREPSAEVALEQEGLYIISVAARILSMHPQTLRKYERIGLIRPARTIGMLRLYSEQDVGELRVIKHLVDEVGLNLAGVELVMSMMRRLTSFRQLLSTTRGTAWDGLRAELQTILATIERR